MQNGEGLTRLPAEPILQAQSHNTEPKEGSPWMILMALQEYSGEGGSFEDTVPVHTGFIGHHNPHLQLGTEKDWKPVQTLAKWD